MNKFLACAIGNEIYELEIDRYYSLVSLHRHSHIASSLEQLKYDNLGLYVRRCIDERIRIEQRSAEQHSHAKDSRTTI